MSQIVQHGERIVYGSRGSFGSHAHVSMVGCGDQCALCCTNHPMEARSIPEKCLVSTACAMAHTLFQRSPTYSRQPQVTLRAASRPSMSNCSSSRKLGCSIANTPIYPAQSLVANLAGAMRRAYGLIMRIDFSQWCLHRVVLTVTHRSTCRSHDDSRSEHKISAPDKTTQSSMHAPSHP